MADFKANRIGFDAARFQRDFLAMLNSAIDTLSQKIIELMRNEIKLNGNGSEDMKDTAVEQVREISRKIDDHEFELVVGIEEEGLGEFKDQTFTRTMVVLHGNSDNGNNPLMTKPGKMTWRKHVVDYHLNKTENKPRMLPKSWNQYDVVKPMLNNIMKQVDTPIKDFENDVKHRFDAMDLSIYVTVR